MGPRDDELDEELQSHLRMAIAERMARGESRESAERAARRELGNVTHIKEVSREVRGGLWLERLAQDLAYGARGLRRTPAFTIAAVLTLALAIGANTAVFTVVNSVLLRPLPFRDPGKLFVVSHLPADLPFELPPGLADGLWLEYRERARVFERVTAYRRRQTTLSGVGDATRLTGAYVDASFFAVLGVAPALGRSFRREEEASGHHRVVMLGDRLWRERFGGDPRVVGTAISLDGEQHVVVGVMPEGFDFPAASGIWTPLTVTRDPGNSFILSVVGRLAEGASAERAKSELEAIVRALPGDARDRDRPQVAAIIPLKDVLTGRIETLLLIFTGAVAFVLLIACANVANLLLIRAAARRREMAVRVALGASRTRIARQLLTESVLVGIVGGAIGILVAVAGVRTLLAIAPAGGIPRIDEVHVDGWVLAFTIGISLITGVIFGLAPALASARRDPGEALARSTRVVGRSQSRMRAMLVASEIALALVLLTGAGLMIRSFVRMRSVDTGYDGARVTTMAVDLPRSSYPDITRVRAFHAALLERLARVPGVRGVGAVTFRPMSGVGIMGDFKVDGPTPLPGGYSVHKTAVSPGYFAAIGMRLVRGRDFSPDDDARTPGVVIVSESVARRVWPDENAVGKRISMESTPRPEHWLTVIGVVNDIVQDGDLTKQSTIYLPYLQFSWLVFVDHMNYVVRSDAEAAGVARAMRAALREVDPTVPAQALQTMDDAMLQVVAVPLFQTRLLGVFALIAVLLAAVGTCGVLAYDVAERTREIGLRMALGATPGDVMRMIMRRAGVLALWGASIGVIGSIAITRVLAHSLFEVTPTDPVTMAVVVAAIVCVAMLAGFVPARRATRTPPLAAIGESL
ncbi:MAG TPA: ABC transporter permease [Gemmatimonadaceae bacterium]|nr:ABC transporter permease [Gemmatimonadaceae bacterium]